MKKLSLLLLLTFITACTSMDKDPTRKAYRKKSEKGFQFNEPYKVVREPKIDPKVVLKKLKIDVDDYGLGIHEKDFNPCRIGVLNKRNSGCSNKVLTYVRYQVLCRNSTGTTDMVTNSELMPLKNRDLVWKIGNKRGVSPTNRKGFGEILFISSSSHYEGKVILKNNTMALGISLENIKKIVVPKDWCH